MVTVSVSDDRAEVRIRGGQPDECDIRLDAADLSSLIARLADARARMSPAFSGGFAPGKTVAFDCDNLIWDSCPDPTRRGIALTFQHAGLGWLRLRLSRAQAEDLIASIQFAVVDLLRLPGLQDLRSLPDDAVAESPNDGNVVPLRRIGV